KSPPMPELFVRLILDRFRCQSRIKRTERNDKTPLDAVIVADALDLGIERPADHGFEHGGAEAIALAARTQRGHRFAPDEVEAIIDNPPAYRERTDIAGKGAVLDRVGRQFVGCHP